MKAKYSKLFLLFFILLLSVFQSSAQQELTFKKFAGTYVTGHEFGRGSIKLEADGTFSTGTIFDVGSSITESGNYILSKGLLHLKITKRIIMPVDDRKDDSLKVEKYLPIEWSERIYLIGESSLEDFANAVNLGLEPRYSLTAGWDTLPWYGTSYLRSGDEQKKVTGNPNLPKKWLSFLLRKPLTATVISVEKVEKLQFATISTVTINKGSKDGLKVGTQLLAKDEEPSLGSGPKVISVEKETAKIQARLSGTDLLKVGDVLSTRYKPKTFYR